MDGIWGNKHASLGLSESRGAGSVCVPFLSGPYANHAGSKCEDGGEVENL